METQNKETYWSRFVNDFEEKQSHVVGQEILLLAHQELLKEVNLGNALELGCGTGLYTETLQKNSKNVVATDFSKEMIVFAQQERGNLENVKFQQADALNLEFDAESFDTVFMANLIHVIGDADKLIKQSKRVLKKGGKLIVNSFAINDMSFLNRITMAFRYIKTFGKPSVEATKEKTTQKSVETLLTSNGFEISKSLLLGRKYKSFYITGIKK